MKKIGLITKNKILAESLSAAMKSTPALEFKPFLLLNSQQALLDAEVFEIDIALIDIASFSLSFCQGLHKNLPNCHLLLLVSQDDREIRKMATEAKKKKVVDDFVFYDASLKYLFAKLTAF